MKITAWEAPIGTMRLGENPGEGWRKIEATVDFVCADSRVVSACVSALAAAPEMRAALEALADAFTPKHCPGNAIAIPRTPFKVQAEAIAAARAALAKARGEDA